ncbi:glycosyltransferase family 2 protein [Cohnella hashimotonis]|uniref:Glycosyltransferase n=1 Tax=Cohnella hashimotonis TaxID=2826895 RepID=A0ABT6TAT4_9BACL|nr:glycosyltransferase [Cohnella hashimotonis]MDI4643935.1 glycosyltransferase [Cohnella hashimotonis]
MKTSIVILAQHPSLFEDCLAAIHKHTPEACELIVVNDGASFEIFSLIERYSDTPIKTIATTERRGVAAGYNLGASAASGERIVLIRDSVTVGPNWFSVLSACLNAHPDAMMAGPLSSGISGQQNARIAAEILNKLTPEARTEALAANGKSQSVSRLLHLLLLVRKDLFDELGGFDERFALESYEDDDLCYRALLAGYRLFIANNCYVRYTPPPTLFPEDPDWFARQLGHNRQAGIEKWGSDLTELLYQWKRSVKVSLCMIVKNEEETLERCLSSVADLVDEIVIVDTGSTDRTKNIAGKFDARIFDFQWVNDFSKARNYAFSQATQEYLLWLDADDILLPADREKFKTLVSALPVHVDVVSMHYHLSRDEYGNVTSSLRRNRLLRRSMGYRWVGAVHEYVEVHGSTLNRDIAVTHDRVHTNSSRNLHIYEGKMAAGETFSPRDTYYFANELYEHGQWERAAEQYEKLLAFEHVWIEDRIGACGKASECYHQLGRNHEAKLKALQSFAYALPRAENCCRLGMFHLSENAYREAAWWYRLASELEMPTDSSALLQHACWTWLPHIQLCVCHDRMGEYALAYEENELAAQYIPNDSRIGANRSYLKSRLEQTK